MYHSIKRFLIGKPLKSQAAGEQKLTKLKALAMLSSDALSSVAYGTEQILIILVAVSAAAFWYSIPIAAGCSHFVACFDSVLQTDYLRLSARRRRLYGF